MDDMADDCDLEGATNAEDEGISAAASRYASMNGAGCPVSDPAAVMSKMMVREEGHSCCSCGINQRDVRHWGGVWAV